jgi:diguanylate cyclase (GGDEF)-like protein/PAS domain S-box-containing protein
MLAIASLIAAVSIVILVLVMILSYQSEVAHQKGDLRNFVAAKARVLCEALSRGLPKDLAISLIVDTPGYDELSEIDYQYYLVQKGGDSLVVLNHRGNPELQRLPDIDPSGLKLLAAVAKLRSGAYVGPARGSSRFISAYAPVPELDAGLVAIASLQSRDSEFIRRLALALTVTSLIFASMIIIFHAYAKRATKSIMQSERKFETLLQNSHGGVIVYDPDFKVLYHNDQALSIHGLEGLHDINGKARHASVIDADERPLLVKDLPAVRALETGQKVGPVVIGIARGDRVDWSLVTATPLKDEQGAVEAVIVNFLDYNPLRKAQETIRESEKMLRESQRISRTGSFEISRDGTIRLSQGGSRILGLDPSKPSIDLQAGLSRLAAADRPLLKETLAKAFSGEYFEIELHTIIAEGKKLTLLANGGPMQADEGVSVDRVVGAFRDVTEERLATEQIVLAGKVYDTTIEGITITDAFGTILTVNAAFENITGYSAAEAIGKNPRILKSEHHDASFYRNLWDTLLDTGRWEGEIWNRRKDGTVYPEWMSITAVKDAAGATTRYVAVFRDRSEAKAREAAIERLSHHDLLTDLPNRHLFLDLMGQALSLAERKGEHLAVAYIDIDGFKHVNDNFGYREGDRILQELAERLRTRLRRSDTLARVGGDEFVILLGEIGEAMGGARALEDILRSIEAPFAVSGSEVFLSASAGLAFWPGDGRTADELVTNANSAANVAKSERVGSYYIYTSAIRDRVVRRFDVESRLRRAIEKEELVLHYQPRISTTDLRVLGMEALVRWRGEDGKLIPPSEFIPLAEDSGLIVPLGEWVLHRALEQTLIWRERGSDLVVSVNLSARQFRDSDVERLIVRALDATRYPPQGLELEITESLAMADIKHTTDLMLSLSSRGIHFSLDDFGTGYSSLAYLKSLPIQWIKIDQSFVRDIGDTDSAANSIVKAIVSMSQSLGIGTIAEGCETSDQFSFLRSLKCDQIQGYFFSRPLPVEEFEIFLLRGAPHIGLGPAYSGGLS